MILTIEEKSYGEALRMLTVILASPSLSRGLLCTLLSDLYQFLSLIQDYLITNSLNAPRIVSWDDQNQQVLLQKQEFILNYLIVLCELLPSQCDEDDFPMASRELTFRLLVNWSSLTAAPLAIIKEYAIRALVWIVRIGPIFIDPPIIDNQMANLLVNIERRGTRVLPHILAYHSTILLHDFVQMYFLHAKNISMCFVEALLCLDERNTQDIYQMSGPLLLLIFVLWIRNEPIAQDFMDFFLKVTLAGHQWIISAERISKKLRKRSFREVLPEYFAYAAEGVFDYASRLSKRESLQIPLRDICHSLVPWVRSIRLLPRQSNCSKASGSGRFNCFTPYQFLVKFMELSVVVNDDDFDAISMIWSELMKCPDHKELLPVFFLNLDNAEAKTKLFGLLLSTDPVNVAGWLGKHCSFAYYYWVTECLKRDFFGDETWILPVLFTAFWRFWHLLKDELVCLTHFAYLFRGSQASDLFALICAQLEVKKCANEDSLVKELAKKLDEEEWGNEALKWVVGCKNVKLATASFAVYNQIQKPQIESNLVASTVLYHVKKSPKDCSALIMEAFLFLANNFAGIEQFSFNFLQCFLESSLYRQANAQLLLKILSSRITSNDAWPLIISMIRPMIPRLERSEAVQKLFDLFIKTCHSEELMMIVAPYKRLTPKLFPAAKPPELLLPTVSDATMCKAISHYTDVVTTASVNLLDSVFAITTAILGRIEDHENNRAYLGRLYDLSLHTLTQCPNGLPFILALMERDLEVGNASHFEVPRQYRSVEDVKRSLARITNEELLSLNPITDCKSYLNCVKFTVAESDVKILPFATNQEMIQGMADIGLKGTRIATIKRLSGVGYQQSGSFGHMRVRSSSSVLGKVDMERFLPLRIPVGVHNDPSRFLEYQVELKYELDAFLGAN
jgi:hypothetical protein